MPGYWSSLAESLHILENHRRELREIRNGRERHPDDPDLLNAEIRAQAALGHVREVNGLLDEAVNKAARPAQALPAFRVAALELRAHRHRDNSLAVGEKGLAFLQSLPAAELPTPERNWQLLRALYVLERWEEAQRVVGEMASLNPSWPPEIRNLLGYQGALAARRGRREEARAIADRLAAMEIPYDRGKATYERARIEALLGENETAVSLLRQAYGEGSAYSLDLHTEMDFEGLEGFGPFEAFLEPRG